MKYIIYSRKSSEGEDRQAKSLDTQERLLRDYADKNKLEIVKIFRESKSAKSDGNRPLFMEMLKDIIEGKANAILTVHTDRLARNLIDAGQIIKLVEVGSLKEVRTLTGTYNNHISLLYMGFDFVFASHYSRDLSVKVKAGNESKLLKGEYPTSSPIGYKNVPGGLEPDPLRAHFITKAFELYATNNFSVKTLTKELNALGFTTKFGNKVAKSVIHRILSNPEYYGVIQRKGQIYKGNHPPLISKSLFDQVQDIIQNKNRPRRQTRNFLYRDFLTCGVCGCKITASIAKHKYTYYNCTNGKGLCDQHRYLSEKSIENLFVEYFDTKTIDEVTASLSLEVYKDSLINSNKNDIEKEKSIKNEINRTEAKLDKLVDLRLDNKIEEYLFEKTKAKLMAEKKRLEEEQQDKSTEDLKTTFELLDKVKIRACKVQEMFKNGNYEVKRDLLNSMVSNCYIVNEKNS